MPIPGARIYQRRPGRLVIPVDLRLGQLADSSAQPSTAPSSAASRPSATFSSPRIAAPNSVTVSMVATASYSEVESSTRRTPTNPACLAAATVTSKIRSGRAEAASRARMSTSTVWLKPGSQRPAHRRRTSSGRRS